MAANFWRVEIAAHQSARRRAALQDSNSAASSSEYSSKISYDESSSESTYDTATDGNSRHLPLYDIGPYSTGGYLMAPATVPASQPGPQPSHIHFAQVYLFQQQLQSQLVAIGTNPTREDNFRLQGVQWINDVRCALQL